MSTYINAQNPNQKNDFTDVPPLAAEFLNYTLTIRGLSPRTVNGYYIDLRTFFKYLVWRKAEKAPAQGAAETTLESAQGALVSLDFIKALGKAEIYEFLYYVTKERANTATTRARKLSALRAFFKYLTHKTGQLPQNPMEDIEMPVRKKRLPKYLSLEESLELLSNIESDYYERDYCIITLFLNCGMRLSELVGLNVGDVKNDTVRVVGKGNKERMVYLNAACVKAVADLCASLAEIKTKRDGKALFISKRTGKRLSPRRVQQIVTACFSAAGLGGKGYSVHKLRHTAATLLYRHGHVDLLSLKEILGHADVSTTEIYTHLDSAQLKQAADASPLAHVKQTQPGPKSEK